MGKIKKRLVYSVRFLAAQNSAKTLIEILTHANLAFEEKNILLQITWVWNIWHQINDRAF